MKKHITLAAFAAFAILPFASQAADEKKAKGPFAMADADNDGKVTLAEYVAAVKGKMDDAAAKARFAKLDKDGDGALTREEFNAGAPKKGEGKKKKDAK